MAYQAGTATGQDDLLTQIITFLKTQGYVEDLALSSVTSGLRAHIHKGSSHYEFRSIDVGSALSGTVSSGEQKGIADTFNNGIVIWPCRDYSAIDLWNAQPTASLFPVAIADANSAGPSNFLTRNIAWPVNYHFFYFTNPEFFLCIIKHDLTAFLHLAIGEVGKFGTWNGGQFASGTYGKPDEGTTLTQLGFAKYNGISYSSSSPGSTSGAKSSGFFAGRTLTNSVSNNRVYAPDLITGDWIGDANNGITSTNFTAPVIKFSISNFNGVSAFSPIYMDHKLSNQIIGWIPYARHCRIDNFGSEEVVIIGSDKYMIIPWYDRTSPDIADDIDINDSGSGNFPEKMGSWKYGLAIKYDGP